MNLFKRQWGEFAFVLLLCLNLVFGYLFIENATDSIDRQNQSYLKEISAQNAYNLYISVSKDLEMLEGITNIISGNPDMATDDIIQILSMENERIHFKRMGYIDLNGQAATTDGKLLDLSGRAYFKEGLKGKSGVSDRMKDYADGEYINVFSVPVYHGDTVTGVIYAAVTTDQFAELLSVESFGGAGKSYIIKPDGSGIVQPLRDETYRFDNFFDELESYGTPAKEIAVAKKNLAEGTGGVMKCIIDGTNFDAAYTKSEINDWYVISVVPEVVLGSITRDLSRSIIVTALIVVPTICLMLWFIVYQNRKNRRELERMAFTDPLTGCPNWVKFIADADAIIKAREDKEFCIVALDIENFKVFNDVFGFTNGSALLQEMAESIESGLESKEMYARVSADNFVVLMESGVDDIKEKFNKMYLSFFSNERAMKAKLCCGIYEVKDRTMNVISMYDRATLAKKTTKGKQDLACAVFDEGIRNKILFEKEIENDMEYALKNEEFLVYYQPKYDPYTEEIKGAEALVRWLHPQKGMISPGEFIPVFEKNGFIKKLDIYVFEKSCELIRKFREKESKGLAIPISVNLSRVHLTGGDFIEQLCRIAKEYGIPSGYLEIEITESAVMEFADETVLINLVKQMKDNGFFVSMDDFGSGYSSLNMLSDVPFDTIKLDRRFFKTNSSADIIKGLIQIIKSLGMQVVAEGIEDESRVDELRTAGCDLIQGFYYSRPITGEQLESKILSEKREWKLDGTTSQMEK